MPTLEPDATSESGVLHRGWAQDVLALLDEEDDDVEEDAAAGAELLVELEPELAEPELSEELAESLPAGTLAEEPERESVL